MRRRNGGVVITTRPDTQYVQSILAIHNRIDDLIDAVDTYVSMDRIDCVNSVKQWGHALNFQY